MEKHQAANTTATRRKKLWGVFNYGGLVALHFNNH